MHAPIGIRILAAMPADATFTPLMTLYLTEDTDPEDLAAAYTSGLITAVKLYPAGATQIRPRACVILKRCATFWIKWPRLDVPCACMVKLRMTTSIFLIARPRLSTRLDPLRRAIPELRVIMEHITTKNGVDYARAGGDNLGATITTHHLIINRNHILVGGIKPHYYCLPVAKREEHRQALVEAATSGDARFFLGHR